MRLNAFFSGTSALRSSLRVTAKRHSLRLLHAMVVYPDPYAYEH
jgi:hypothetical protein